MTFNVDTKTISLYLAAEAAERAYNEAQEKFLYALITFALRRPLSRHLTNQDTPNNLERIVRPGSHNAPWVAQAIDEGKAVWQFRPEPFLARDIAHVADWIHSAVLNRELWLHLRDARGAPRKLAKLHSIEQAVHEADKAMGRRNAGLSREIDSQHIETVKTFPDSTKIVRLLTHQALDAEGAAMGHCVGHGSYDHTLETGTSRFFSLRSPSGKACVTLEIDTAENALIQCCGRQNSAPIAKYRPYIRDFVEEHNLRLVETTAMTGLVQANNRVYEIDKLPENFFFDGDLQLSEFQIKKLPDGLHVTGDLNIRNTPIPSLPARLRIDGDLDAGWTELASLPSDIEVSGFVDLEGTKIRALPEDFRPRSSMNLSSTPIQKLPANFCVPGSLYLNACMIQKLPPGLKIGEDLELFRCRHLKEIPSDLFVGKNLNLTGTSIRALPDNLWVPNNLSINHTPLTTLPRKLIVGGTLFMSGTKIKEIPADIFIGKTLVANNNHLRSLPEKLRIPGALYLHSTTIDSLPSHMDIGDYVFLNASTKLPYLPEYFTMQIPPGTTIERLRLRTNYTIHKNRNQSDDHEIE